MWDEYSTTQISLVSSLVWAGGIIDIDLFHGWQLIGLQGRMGGAHKSIWPASVYARSVQKIDKETLNKKQDLALKQLLTILTELDHTLPSMTHKSLHKLIKNKPEFNSLKLQATETIFKSCGYQLAVKPSQLPNGGKGVFVIKGTVLKGQLVALYPGM